MRILSWNIRQGGGRRLDGIVAAIERRSPDVLVVNELRARTTALLCERLDACGLTHVEHTSPEGFQGGTLVAARTPLRRLPASRPSKLVPQGLLEVELSSGVVIAAVYGPMLTRYHERFWNALVKLGAANVTRPYLIIGDFNTGEAGVDAYKTPFAGSPQFVALRSAGFVDLWRAKNDATEHTWFSFGKGGVPLNGFRLDHALASPPLACTLDGCHYSHAEREERLSDHSMLIVELARA